MQFLSPHQVVHCFQVAVQGVAITAMLLCHVQVVRVCTCSLKNCIFFSHCRRLVQLVREATVSNAGRNSMFMRVFVLMCAVYLSSVDSSSPPATSKRTVQRIHAQMGLLVVALSLRETAQRLCCLPWRTRHMAQPVNWNLGGPWRDVSCCLCHPMCINQA